MIREVAQIWHAGPSTQTPRLPIAR
jgi:hypothetical protein